LGGSRLLDGRETILLVDDEHPFRSVMRAMLAFRGYTVLEAVDGAEAVQRYRDAHSQIDLILLDLQMPRMNGWDTLDKILEINPAARVLLLSGGQTDPPPGRASADQANGIISKPFDTVVMLRTLREILDKPGPGNRRSPDPLPPESGK
jgi:CheY-like chemotaxis protein